jgi:hypothetical protein
MSDKLYGLTEEDRRWVQHLVQSKLAEPPPAAIPAGHDTVAWNKSPAIYWALPPCESGIPAAEISGDGQITPGSANCCLFRYDSTSNKLTPVTDAAGVPLRAIVRNHYFRVANDYVQVWRHKNGTWANERPEVVAESSATTTTTTGEPEPIDPVCQGECLFVAGGAGGGGLTWKPASGGCANTTTTTTSTTTTSTTTTSTTTTSTTTTSTTTTTASPCPNVPCMLRCVAATTTTSEPGATTAWPPPPSTGYIYQVIGTDCNSPCSCFGAGDPCYLLNGEIQSKCVYIVTTTPGPTTTSTTPGPISGPGVCEAVSATLGIPAPGTYRVATLKSYPSGWIVCQDCPDGEFPMFPRGASDPVDPDPAGDVVAHESPCGRSPCADSRISYTPNKAVYRAYDYFAQVQAWQAKPGSDQFLHIEGNRYLANWRVCQSCPSGFRPANPPSNWLFFDDALNVSPVSRSQQDGLYLYETSCVPGTACEACEYAPLSWTATSTTTSIPTPMPTTTRAMCGCESPTYCPSTLGECVRTRCSPGGASKPVIPCPTTTTSPGQFLCWDYNFGVLCNCGSTTTSTTTTTASSCSGSCSAIYVRGGLTPVSTCAPTCNCVYPTTSTTPSCGTIITGTCQGFPPAVPPQCSSCLGGCYFFAQYANGYGSPLKWVTDRLRSVCSGVVATPTGYSDACSCSLASSEGELPSDWGAWLCSGDATGTSDCCCGCYPPATAPASICDIAETPCESRRESPCACCTTQPCDKQCTFKGNGTGGWTKIDDPCPSTCPCPQYPPSISQSDCDIRRYTCGSSIPTTTAGPSTTTSTTTPGPGACCFPGGACDYLSYSACRTAGGTHQGAGVTCASVSCPTTVAPTTTQQYGACCYTLRGENFCEAGADAARCAYLQGTLYRGQTCAQANCFPTTTAAPTGRCCVYYYGVFQWCVDDVLQASCNTEGFGAGWSSSWAQGQTCNGGCPPGPTTTTTTTTTVALTTTIGIG